MTQRETAQACRCRAKKHAEKVHRQRHRQLCHHVTAFKKRHATDTPARVVIIFSVPCKHHAADAVLAIDAPFFTARDRAHAGARPGKQGQPGTARAGRLGGRFLSCCVTQQHHCSETRLITWHQQVQHALPAWLTTKKQKETSRMTATRCTT